MIDAPALIVAGGLLADIVGFYIIIRDVLPEYRLYRWKAQSDEYHRSTLYAVQQAKDPEPARRVAQDAIGKLPLAKLRVLRTSLRLPKAPFEDDGRRFDAAAVERSRAEVEAALAEWRKELDQKTRPPIMTGVLLIFLGFGCQIVGTLWGAYQP